MGHTEIANQAETFEDIVGRRAIRTHDSKGVELLAGNRQLRRLIAQSSKRGRGERKHPKQFHKQGH